MICLAKETYQITGRVGEFYWCDLRDAGINFVADGTLENIQESIDWLECHWYLEGQQSFVRATAIAELERIQQCYWDEMLATELMQFGESRAVEDRSIAACVLVALLACVIWFVSY